MATQLPCELVGANVHRQDMGRALLEQTVREAAGGRADVEALEAGDVEAKVRQRALELDASPADVGVIQTPEAEG